ncbi:helix-turn-helix domain-containing protein [Paenibacillus hodogayensis]|uniref:Helix-turn-helix domain-containing protein n=1 Tax=Paenibacillus hodogayensis TaxID=279208 RepID=A0ABV5VVM0_9BACL
MHLSKAAERNAPFPSGRAFFAKLFVSMICIGIVPHLLMSIVAYYNASTAFSKQSAQNSIHYLNQTITAVEIVVRQILDSSQQLVLNRAFRDFENFPNGMYYETIEGGIEPRDLAGNYSYLIQKQSVRDNVKTFKLSNEFVDSVFLYESDKRTVLAMTSDNSSISTPFEQFYDKDWEEPLRQSLISPAFIDTRLARQYDGTQKNVLTILIRTETKNNAIIVNLDAAKLYNHVMRSLSRSDELYVANGDGRILLGRDESLVHRDIRTLFARFDAHMASPGSLQDKWKGETVQASFAKSAVLGWWFIHATDLGKVLDSLTYLKRNIMYSAALLVAIAVLVAVLSSNRLYRPFSFALTERNYFRDKLEESLPYYRERFKLSLLRPNGYTPEDIADKVEQLQAGVPLTGLRILLIACEPPDEGSGGQAEGYVHMLRLMEALSSAGALTGTAFATVEVDTDKIAVLAGCGSDRSRAFPGEIGLALIEELELALGMPITIGVSRYCESAADLPRAYEEAEEALKYRIVWGSGQMIWSEDVEADRQSRHYTISATQSELLCGYVKSGQPDKAAAAYRDIADDIRRNGKLLHYNQIVPLFVRLLNDIIDAAGQTGFDMQSFFKDASPYQSLVGQRSLSAIDGWFETFIAELGEAMRQELNSHAHGHAGRIKQLLDREYANDVSLQTVSDSLGLSPAYVSRLFKQMTGQSFVDYVTALRIEKSKELLRQPELKINEIGRRVGYPNGYYFTRVFKEHAGVTPGVYRKLHL